MSTRQIHELPTAGALAPSDRLVVSTQAGNLTRRATMADLPVRAHPAAQVRTLAQRAGEMVSVRDFGAVGDGIADDGPAFQAALDAAQAVFVPAGRYRLASTVEVRPRRRISGAGRDITTIDARGAHAFSFRRNAGVWREDATATDDWNRSTIEALTIEMTSGGIRAEGHELLAQELRFRGGAPGAWCLELEDSNECALRDIAAGTGGGVHDLLANGIRLRAALAANYGDGLLQEIVLKLKSPNAIGILVEHTGALPYVMNNLLLERVQVNSAGVPAGSVGVWLKRVMRSTLLNVDVEFVDTAFRVEGAAGGGNAGSVRHLSFLNCYVLNCTTPWVDSNAALPGSVMRCLFSNCNGFGLLNPVGVGSTDAQARAGEGDTFLPGAVWLSEPDTGQAATTLRAAAPGRLLVTGDFHDGSAPARDGNPKNRVPRQALGIDVTSANITRLYRPRGLAAGEESRLVVGNGEDFRPNGVDLAPLHRVEIADPLLLPARTSEPPSPRDGMVVQVQGPSALPAGTPWAGAGWYSRQAGSWVPGVTLPGRVPDRERNVSFQLSPLDFGQIHRVNNSADRTVTIASTYTLGATTLPLLQAGDPDAVLWLIRQGSGRVLLAAGDSGVQLRISGPRAEIGRQHQLLQLTLRFNATSGKIEVYANTQPDAQFLYEQGAHWTTGSADPANPYLVPPAQLGKLLRVSSAATSHIAFDSTFVPPALDGVRMAVVKAGPGDVVITAAAGMTLRPPGGGTSFTLAEQNRIVTVHLIGAQDPHQPNSIFIET
jgi:hypothetical protein